MAYQNILVQDQKGICRITVNRPEKRNALDNPTWNEIREAFQWIRTHNDIQVVILTGAGGKSFASGADINTLQQRTALQMLYSGTQTVLNEIESLSKPVIAAIDGFALGGGCELAMACDIRIATARSKFGLPEVNLGIIPGGGGTQRLQRLVGIGKAKELIFTGAIISAGQAEHIGLVNQVVESPEELLPAAEEMAASIQKKGPVAVSVAKIVINAGANTDLASGLLLERLAETVVFSTEDRMEGTTAFLEKRPATFKGR